jgi:uncharacterized protein (DUF2249 family)
MSTNPTVVDVRACDGAPFDTIDAALTDLTPDGMLVLVSDFEPEPLYAVLDSRGFEHATTRTDDGTWRVEIRHA